MGEWLRTEFGGFVIALVGYALRALADDHHVAWKEITKRIVMAVLAALVIIAAIPNDWPHYLRVGAMLLAGAATPELVKVFTRAALKRVEDKINE
jgi:MFS-type transporter involved in bile tolerance (Atg22 family)